MKHPYLEMIANRVPVIFNGPYGTEIQKYNLSKDDFGGYHGCNEYLNIVRPDLIEAIHGQYLEAGAHVVYTNTFGGSRHKLEEFGLGDRTREINKAAAAIAREAVKKCGGTKQRFVCGSLGPTGFLPSSNDKELSAISFDRLVDIFQEQAQGLLDGGIDLFLIETSQDLLEVRAAIYAIRRRLNQKIPLQVQATMDANGRMLLGSDVPAFLGAVQGMGVDIVGLNCSSGPDEMRPWIDQLLDSSILPIAMLPNAGLPCNVDGKAVYKMGAQEFADKMRVFVADKGVSVVGGCCGTTPEHIGALSNALDGVKVAKRSYRCGGQSGIGTDNEIYDHPAVGAAICRLPFHETASARSCFLSTGISGIDLERIPKPIIIGERLNTQGSKKTKEHVINHNLEELYHIAQEQIDHKSHLIDICVAANELDVAESEMMGSVVKFLRDRIAVPFCIDTTEPAVLEAALKKSPGAVLINSINLEHGGEKARKILSFAADFGCPVIALTIDDAGMAATADRKLEIAGALRKLACDEYRLPEHYLYIDPLVFTLATGDAATANAALETLEALRRIKAEFPNVRTAMGVSNVSFGLKPKARRILNNLMLHHAVNAGLDAAIFNPLHVDNVNKYDPAIRELAEDLLFNRRQDSLYRFVDHFETLPEPTSSKGKIIVDGGVNNVDKDICTGQSPENQLRNAVLSRDKRNLAATINRLLETKSASDILNVILLPAMSKVGELMAAGEMILPFVLQAAEVMKEAVSVLEPHLKEEGGNTAKGKIVIATVYGDVHDIGKNLVASILRNQGFDVIDLGKQVSVDAIVDAVRREKPDIVGLSALLVTTSQEMGRCVREFARLGINTPVVIGGAAVNKDFAAKISVLEDGSGFVPGVHYARDAFGVVKIFDGMNKKLPVDKGQASPDKKTSSSGDKKSSSGKKASPIDKKTAKHKKLKHDYYIEPPFHGTGGVLTWDAESLLSAINGEHLFKAWWGGGNLEADDYASARKEEFEPVFERLSAEIIKDALIDARAFYGFFPVITEDEKLILLDPSDNRTEVLSFVFPRMKKSGVSLADYLRPDGDIISMQAVTIGGRLGDRCRSLLLNQDRYSDGYYLNGLGGCLTEAVADRVSAEIRRGLGLPQSSGRRYSFGYAGMPDLAEQKRLIEYLGVEERLGVTLTEGFQMQPEHSTVAIFVHHPDAEYLY